MADKIINGLNSLKCECGSYDFDNVMSIKIKIGTDVLTSSKDAY